MPWFAAFEWSKSDTGRRRAKGPLALAALLLATAVLSLLAEATIDALVGGSMATLGLSILRRLPAMGISTLLILWSRGGQQRKETDETNGNLVALAPSIGWVEAANNYIALHIAGRTVMRRMTMRDAEQVLGPRGFIRIHRRYLVNRNRIAAILGGTEPLIRLDSGIELPVGRSFAANLPYTA